MAEMKGNIGSVNVSVEVDIVASEQFDRIAKMLGYVRERTCKYVLDEKMGVWHCSECGGLEPCSSSVNYCCDCGDKVVGNIESKEEI